MRTLERKDKDKGFYYPLKRKKKGEKKTLVLR